MAKTHADRTRKLQRNCMIYNNRKKLIQSSKLIAILLILLLQAAAAEFTKLRFLIMTFT